MRAHNAERKAGLLAGLRTIFWAFAGIAHRQNVGGLRLKPAQVVVAGMFAGALLVLVLVIVARLVVMGHGAPS